MKDFFAFRKLVTPGLVKVVFWIGVVWCLFAGGADIAKGGNAIRGTGMVMKGLAVFFLGPVGVRMLCELLTSVFSISDNLAAIRQAVAPQETLTEPVQAKKAEGVKNKLPQKPLIEKFAKKTAAKDEKPARNNGAGKAQEEIKTPLKSDLKNEVESIKATEDQKKDESARIKI